MTQTLPRLAYLLGIAGVLPMLACAAGAISAGSERVVAMSALIGYTAVILSFLGAVHWGFALATPAAWEGPVVNTARQQLILGVVPALLGWTALLLMLLSLPDLAVILLIVGFISTTAAETHWSGKGLLPHGYLTLRWILSSCVTAILAAVLLIRLSGVVVY